MGHFKTIQNLQRFPILPFLHTCVEYSVNFFVTKGFPMKNVKPKRWDYLSIQTSKYPDIQVFSYPSIQISKYPDIQVSTYPSILIRISNSLDILSLFDFSCHYLCFQKLCQPYWQLLNKKNMWRVRYLQLFTIPILSGYPSIRISHIYFDLPCHNLCFVSHTGSF